jgi:hypothetical protein
MADCSAPVATIGPVFAQSGGSHDGHVGEMVSPDQVKWQTMPREWANGPPPPPGVSAPPEVAIIWGDPTKEGAPFMFRLRSSLKGTIVPVPPHTHPTDERITVLSGVFCVGMGDNYDPSSCRDMPAGSYIIMPAGMHHFAVAKDSVIEVYGIGPFKINWVREPG